MKIPCPGAAADVQSVPIVVSVPRPCAHCAGTLITVAIAYSMGQGARTTAHDHTRESDLHDGRHEASNIRMLELAESRRITSYRRALCPSQEVHVHAAGQAS